MKKFPGAIIAKIVVILKLRRDGSKKIRIIVDMLRNGVNGMIRLRERIVLPRVSDVVEGTLDLWAALLASLGLSPNVWVSPDRRRIVLGEAGVEFMIIDFADTFYTMKLMDEEFCNSVGQQNGGQ